jgi:hypothetical protein
VRRGAIMTAPTDPCSIAFERYKNLARWRNLWTILLFIFGASVTIFLIGAIFLFINESWLPGAISTLGTMVNAAGVSWVVTRRGEAVTEETEAYEDVKSVCGGSAKASAAGGAGSVLEQLENVRKLYRVFGVF